MLIRIGPQKSLILINKNKAEYSSELARGTMETSLKKLNLKERSNQTKKLTQSISRIFLAVDRFFTLTAADRYKAGINTSGEGRSNTPH
jgi:hypothetical protein